MFRGFCDSDIFTINTAEFERYLSYNTCHMLIDSVIFLFLVINKIVVDGVLDLFK